MRLAVLFVLTGCEVVFPLRDPDAGAELDVPIADTPPPGKRIFATSTIFTGNLGGLSDADASCSKQANAAGLAGMYVAFLSDGNRSANDRMSKQGPFVTTARMVIANDYDDLVDGVLANPIDTDETGTFIEQDTCVWTGTSSAGEIAPGEPNCNDWTSSAPAEEGLAGSTDVLDAGWASGCLRVSCAGPARLYCVEQ